VKLHFNKSELTCDISSTREREKR